MDKCFHDQFCILSSKCGLDGKPKYFPEPILSETCKILFTISLVVWFVFLVKNISDHLCKFIVFPEAPSYFIRASNIVCASFSFSPQNRKQLSAYYKCVRSVTLLSFIVSFHSIVMLCSLMVYVFWALENQVLHRLK